MNIEVFSGVVLLNSQKRIYLIKEEDKNQIGQGRWNLPGGSLDEGETLMGSAERETLEETGYQAEIKSVLGLYQGMKGKKTWLYMVFGAKIKTSGRIRPTDSSVKEGRWFSKEEFLGMKQADLVHPDMKTVYRAALADEGLILKTISFDDDQSKKKLPLTLLKKSL